MNVLIFFHFQFEAQRIKRDLIRREAWNEKECKEKCESNDEKFHSYRNGGQHNAGCFCHIGESVGEDYE